MPVLFNIIFLLSSKLPRFRLQYVKKGGFLCHLISPSDDTKRTEDFSATLSATMHDAKYRQQESRTLSNTLDVFVVCRTRETLNSCITMATISCRCGTHSTHAGIVWLDYFSQLLLLQKSKHNCYLNSVHTHNITFRGRCLYIGPAHTHARVHTCVQHGSF